MNMVPCGSEGVGIRNIGNLYVNHQQHLCEYWLLLLLFMIKQDILELLHMLHISEMVYDS